MRAALDEPGHRLRATELAGMLDREDGAGAVLTRIEQLAG